MKINKLQLKQIIKEEIGELIEDQAPTAVENFLISVARRGPEGVIKRIVQILQQGKSLEEEFAEDAAIIRKHSQPENFVAPEYLPKGARKV
jgi:hypothetical protein